MIARILQFFKDCHCRFMWNTGRYKEHRWSGWPGAFCLDCGTEDPNEIFIADGDIDFVEDLSDPTGIRMVYKPGVRMKIMHAAWCREPGSNRCNPYAKLNEVES